MQAGNLVGYQHYVPWRALLQPPHAWFGLVLVMQTLVVARESWRRRQALRTGLTHLGGWRLAAVALVFVLTSATLSRDPGRYLGELILASSIQLLHLATVICLVCSIPAPRLARLFPAGLRPPPGGSSTPLEPAPPDRFAWVLAAGVTVLAALLALVSYQRHPHVPDEVVYLLHAHYLAAGHLTLPLPPVPEAFNLDLMMYEGSRWYSPVPPGWPFILALGAAVGLPWLVNPVLGGVNVLLAHLLLRECYPAATTRVVLLLLALSPWHLFMAMNLMTHTATMSAALLATWAVLRLRRVDRLRWAVVGGAGLGLVGLIRPLEAAAIAPLLGVLALHGPAGRWRPMAAGVLTATSLAVGALVLPYNRHLTGSATTFPIMAYTDRVHGPGRNALGFGPDRGLGWEGLDPLPGHGPADVVINANLNFFQVNVELFGWATGSLLVLALFLAAGRKRPPDWWMVAGIVMVAGIHSLYYFSGGPDFGARYWFLILLPAVVLTVRGLEWLAAEASSLRPYAAALALSAVALAVFVPWRAVDKYHHYRGMRPDIRRLARDHGFRGSVVLVRGDRHPDYASAAAYNPVDFRGPAPLYAWDRGPEVRQRLAEAFADRDFWIVDGPSRTGNGFVVTHGPLSAHELATLPDEPAGTAP